MLWHQQVQVESAIGCSSYHFGFLTVSTGVISDQAATRQPSNAHRTLLCPFSTGLSRSWLPLRNSPNVFPLFISQGLIRESRNRERSGLRAAS